MAEGMKTPRNENRWQLRPHLSKEKNYEALKELFKHHIESFDYMVEYGLDTMLQNIKPIEVFDSFSKLKLRIWFGKPELYPPQKERFSRTMADALYPFECRQAKLTYAGKFLVDIYFQYADGAPIREKFNFGQFPIMLKSKLCHLKAADLPKKLVLYKEDPSEMGGYFILNGLERVIRLLILPKRNYPMSMVRNSFRDKREGYTDKAVAIRSVRQDQSAVTIKLYYLNNGSARLGFWIQGREYLLPVGIILKALADTTDHEIYVSLTCCYNELYDRVKGSVGTQLIGERAKIILDELHNLSLFTHAQCLQHIGEHFRPAMAGMENESYLTVAEAVLRDYIFVHLDNNHDKFNLLIFMLQKLFSLIDQTSVPDNPDSLQNQEVLLPGHLITIYLKEKLQDWLLRVKRLLQDEIDNGTKKFELSSLADVKKVIDKNSPRHISAAVENLLKTGRLVTQSGLDLQQRAGMTVQADRLNFLRFISHFRAVHRGASFAGLRTTSVRKLLPESWGFLCPVHTPDGEPCGLLNHMTSSCLHRDEKPLTALSKKALILEIAFLIVNFSAWSHAISSISTNLSSSSLNVYVYPSPPQPTIDSPPTYLTHLSPKGTEFYDSSHCPQPPHSISLNPFSKLQLLIQHKTRRPSNIVRCSPSLYLLPKTFDFQPHFLEPKRPSSSTRPVPSIQDPLPNPLADIERPSFPNFIKSPYILANDSTQFEGGCPASNPIESPVSSSCITSLSISPFLAPSTHNTSAFFVPKSLTFIDLEFLLLYVFATFVVKGVASCSITLESRLVLVTECYISKKWFFFLYLIHELKTSYAMITPQTPIVRTKAYEKYNIDDYPLGTNAIVAVLAYSGYDMEDAMVLNKSSVDRGMCHGYIYQTETIDLNEQGIKADRSQRTFGRSNLDKSSHQFIDIDGLPYVGQRINPNDPFYSIYDEVTSKVTNIKLKGSEPVVVDYVAVDVKNKKHLQKANIRLRRTRNPIIGDKFSSRHGQKGVCSQLWPDVDMPFSGVTGMRPDLIINPHAFPSRMTIAMLLESIAAKGGALHGNFVDATPFSSSIKKNTGGSENETTSLVDELGSLLIARGFNYHGVEVLYSGVYGTELTCEIFIGPVYYQRLRHMVSDKFQVRSTGTVDQVTRQPIKGRKRGGGIRFGEMERDSLLAHGAAYLLHDRLHTSSDHHIADVCSLCGSILTTSIIQSQKRAVREMIGDLPPGRAPKKVTCVACQSSKGMETVAMPYVFRYLAAELAAMNIKMTLQLSNGSGA
ncbi:DNA-directed RNA polymerase I subunit 2 [Olea europaea var. sylvestris]|uniref:DNA-directed RNA polymerase I subunit 2 n=1 Tax=Olea europaea var. sylvestris TaxID=158386 RepID=UPI000C1D6111|nr:DNA-directed RNA polymerase I subunit 2 [Olea europaea var. sylvestris]